MHERVQRLQERKISNAVRKHGCARRERRDDDAGSEPLHKSFSAQRCSIQCSGILTYSATCRKS
jgi:hypothetical protein